MQYPQANDASKVVNSNEFLYVVWIPNGVVISHLLLLLSGAYEHTESACSVSNYIVHVHMP